jgi:replicative DNA helicase
VEKKIKKTKVNKAEHPNVKAKQIPQNFDAEKAVLGSIMLDSHPSLLVNDGLKVQDFSSIAHRHIFEAMYSLALKDSPIDIVTLIQQLDTDGTKDKVGGLSFVSSLVDSVPSSTNFKYYKEIVKKNSLLRSLIDECNEIMDICFSGDPTDNALQFAETAIYKLAENEDKSVLVPIQPELVTAIKQLEDIAANPKAMRGIPTPFKGLNYLLGGLQRTDLILIAARPGQGKTSIGMNLISHAALTHYRKTESGKHDPFRCAVFSLEMPGVQLAKRMLCSVAKIDMHKANSGELNASDWKELFYAKSKLDESKIYIDDSSLTTPVEILSKCRRLKRERGLDLVMIDYLQLMSSGRRTESRQQEISEITRTLKIAAKELNVPILLLSQMSRDIEKRTDKTPQMSDLRESGAIEQDADIIIFIHRKYDMSDESVDELTKNKVELHIAKHRNGSTGKVEVVWQGNTVSFVDYLNTSSNSTKQKHNIDKSKKTENKTKEQQIFGTPPPLENEHMDSAILSAALDELDNSGL